MSARPMSIPGRIMAFASSLQLTVIGLFVLMLLTIWGTLYQVDHGLYQAQEDIYLLDFQKELYTGTSIARRYSSKVVLRDGELEREILISMNKPLRYRGLTFYQSSYKEFRVGTEATVLAVVKNHGRMMPYVATFLTFFGMAVTYSGRLAHRLKLPSSPREAR